MYIIFSKPQCHHIIDHLNFCKHCVEASKSLDVTSGLDNDGFTRKFNAKYNDYCVSAFRKTRDDDDVASAVVTILSIVCHIVFKKLSDNPVFKIVDNIPGTIVFPNPDNLEAIVPFESNNISASNHSNVSGDVSHAASLNKYTNQIMIRDGLCNIKKQSLKSLDNKSGIVKLNELEKMNED